MNWQRHPFDPYPVLSGECSVCPFPEDAPIHGVQESPDEIVEQDLEHAKMLAPVAAPRSRPITVEELRRVVHEYRDDAASVYESSARDSPMEAAAYLLRELLAVASNALAALPAEQERCVGCGHGSHLNKRCAECAKWCVMLPAEQEPATVAVQCGDPQGLWVGREPEVPRPPMWSDFVDETQAPSSAVPELPPVLTGGNFRVFTSTGWYDLGDTRQAYDALRTLAESLRERLVEALRERDEARANNAASLNERFGLYAQLNDAADERRELRKLAWEQATRADKAEAKRDKAAGGHCRDCCCTQAWKALGITEYTGKHVAEHVAELKAERDALRSQIEQAQRQEPWGYAWRSAVIGSRCYVAAPAATGLRSSGDMPLYSAPVPAADVAQQIVAAEQRGRAEEARG